MNAKDLKTEVKLVKLNPKGIQVLLSNVQLNWVYLAKPDTRVPGQAKADDTPKYKVTALVSKIIYPVIEKELKKLAAQLMLVQGKWVDKKEQTQAIETAFDVGAKGSLIKDGDGYLDKNGNPYNGLPGHVYIRAETHAEETAPGLFKPKWGLPIVDVMNKPIPIEQLADRCYSGVYATLLLTIGCNQWPGDRRGEFGRSLKAYLGGVQILADGEKLNSSNPFAVRSDLIESPFTEV